MNSYFLYIDEAYKNDQIIISALLTAYPIELKDFPISYHCSDKYCENISKLKDYIKNREFDSSLTVIYSEKGKELTKNEYITLYFLLPILLNNFLIPIQSSITILVDSMDDRIKDYKININQIKSLIGKYIGKYKIYVPSPLATFLNKDDKGKYHKNGLSFVDCSSTSLAKDCKIIFQGKFKRGTKKLYIDKNTLKSMVQTLNLSET